MMRQVTTIRKSSGFDASLIQVKRAYRAYYHRDMEGNMTFPDAAARIANEIGWTRTRTFVLAQSNDVDAAPVCLFTVENPDA